jgi:hypothetical protein
MNHGAHFVGDEWVFVSADGSSMLGLPMPMSISEWQIKHIPRFAPEIKFQQQILFQSIKAIERLHTALKQTWLRKRYTFKWLDKALPYFKKQLKIYTLPQDLFRNQVGNLKAVPQKIFLILGHPGPDIRIERSDAAKLALQFAQVSEYELQDFMKYYQAYKFAFPGIENDFLEDVSNLQRRLLKPALAGKDAFTVYYPYGESLELLFEKINSFCFSDNKNASASDLKELNLAPISRETIK